ncbi:MAG: hypothetical protein NZ772_00115 [Cyanobacteria bacterium]|nr:hypothetical protein [Cyanobacteriota bacterium]MDW8199616.1 hypothetical protein [Cyanobacteriota bacterium SKYGB_h_bin112]
MLRLAPVVTCAIVVQTTIFGHYLVDNRPIKNRKTFLEDFPACVSLIAQFYL